NLALLLLARLLVAVLAVVHDPADGRPLLGGHLDQIELCLAGHLQRLGGRDDAQLLPVDPDEPNRADADLLVDALVLLLAVVRVTVAGTNLVPSLARWERAAAGPRPGRLAVALSPVCSRRRPPSRAGQAGFWQPRATTQSNIIGGGREESQAPP